jgi:hypothetical protein
MLKGPIKSAELLKDTAEPILRSPAPERQPSDSRSKGGARTFQLFAGALWMLSALSLVGIGVASVFVEPSSLPLVGNMLSRPRDLAAFSEKQSNILNGTMDANYALLQGSFSNKAALCDSKASARFDDDLLDRTHVVAFADIQAKDATAACSTATEAYPTVRRLFFELGRAYDKDKQSHEAEKAYEVAVARGSTAAMVNLGILYEEGKIDPAVRARDLYEKSARGGNAEGMYCFATVLEKGIGGPADLESAKKWYQQATQSEYANRGAKEAFTKLQLGAVRTEYRCGS